MYTHLYQLLRDRAARFPNADAVGSQYELLWNTLSSRDLLTAVDRLAAELGDLVQCGDRVVFWVPNEWRTLAYYFAIWKLGGVVVPFDREMNPEAGARILASVEPRAILVGYGERPAWCQGVSLEEWWVPGSRAQAAQEVPSWTVPDEQLAALMFTSGTTGIPKGCMITHANISSQVETIPERVHLDTSSRLASILPLSHLLGLTGELYALSAGAAIHYVPSRRPADVLRVLSEQGITHMVVVPQLLTIMGRSIEQELAEKLPERALSWARALAPRLPLSARRALYWPVHQRLGGHLRMFLSGGAALPDETHQLWERLGVRIVQGYGTSECSPIVTLGSHDGRTPLGSVGKPLRNVHLKLGPDGELHVQGPNVMQGYWRDPGRTAEVLSDGWYATGDLAEIDSESNVRIIGRAKELIALPSGLKVWPDDVEEVLRSHPVVKDAAIMTVPTSAGGMVLHAYLLPASLSTTQEELARIVAECNAHLAVHQRVASASWYPAPDFPRTSTLKVRRHLLPQPDQTAVVAESTEAIDDPIGQAISAVARQVGTVSPEQTLAELGIDSLGLVELAAIIESKTGKPIADQDLSLAMTMQQLRATIAAAPGEDSAEQRMSTPGDERVTTEVPVWPYTWGRVFRLLSAPFNWLLRLAATHIEVMGEEHLAHLPPRVIIAGTHHGFPDMPLVRYALTHNPAGNLASRLIVPISAGGFGSGGIQFGRGLGFFPWYGILALGLYPLRQRIDRDASLRGLARLAQRGNPVLIFPQGTHAHPEEERVDSPRVRFHPGVGHLARSLDALVVPFGIAGTERMMPADPTSFKGLKIAGVPVELHKGPLAIAFGPPVRIGTGDSPAKFAVRLQSICYALTRQAEAAINNGDDTSTVKIKGSTCKTTRT